MRAIVEVVRRQDRARDDAGSVTVLTASLLVVIIGMVALAVDVGSAFAVKAELQNAADSAALGAAAALPDEAEAVSRAVDLALQNHPELTAGDVQAVVGTWDAGSGTFSAGGSEPNAVQVTASRAGGNAVPTPFASVLGHTDVDVSASSIALLAFSNIDFEGFAEGATPHTVSHGNGVSGEFVAGQVSVRATSNRNNSSRCPRVPASTGPRHCEMIFDGPCTGGCTGGDSDLYFPAQGNILIITEDGDAGDPDDEARGGTFTFDFTAFGPGTVSVQSIALLDIDETDQAVVTLYDETNTVIDVAYLSGAGDGVAVEKFVSSVSGVAVMTVKLPGSGAIDDIGYMRVVKLVQ